jgi:hypothetical protein
VPPRGWSRRGMCVVTAMETCFGAHLILTGALLNVELLGARTRAR